METGTLSHDELITFAALLFGDDWRNGLSEKLGISRKSLVLTLAAGDPVPDEITHPVVALLDEHVRLRKREIRDIEKRLVQIREKFPDATQPGAAGTEVS